MKHITLSNILEPPQFEDEEIQRIAKVIYGLSVSSGKIWVESEGIDTGSTFCFTLQPQRKTKLY